MPNKISQKEFAQGLRDKFPQLKDFNDVQIVNKILQIRPDLKNQIANPMSGDDAASIAQDKATEQSHHMSLISPDFWEKHPRGRAFTNSVLDAMPSAGGIIGGALSTPETLGVGTIPGAAIGTGVGKGAEDFASEVLGSRQSSPLRKATNIGTDTAIAAAAPGVASAISSPIKTARMAAGSLSNAESKLLPPFLQSITKMPWLDEFAQGGKPAFDPLVRQADRSFAGQVVHDYPNPPAWKEGEILNDNLLNESKTGIHATNPPVKKLYPAMSSEGQSPTAAKQMYDEQYARLGALRDKATSGKITIDELKEGQALDKILRGMNFQRP